MAVDTKVSKELKVAYGTANMTKGPAMTRAQAVQALEAGIEMVSQTERRRIRASGNRRNGNWKYDYKQCSSIRALDRLWKK